MISLSQLTVGIITTDLIKNIKAFLASGESAKKICDTLQCAETIYNLDIRKGQILHQPVGVKQIVIYDICIHEAFRGQGISISARNYLQKYPGTETVIFQCITNEPLREHLLKNGYRPLDSKGDTLFWGKCPIRNSRPNKHNKLLWRVILALTGLFMLSLFLLSLHNK